MRGVCDGDTLTGLGWSVGLRRLTLEFCSLYRTRIGPEGAIALAAALPQCIDLEGL